MVGFEAVGDKWLHETRRRGGRMHESKETNSDQTTNVQERTIKNAHSALFLEKVFCGLRSRTTYADVNKIKSSAYI